MILPKISLVQNSSTRNIPNPAVEVIEHAKDFIRQDLRNGRTPIGVTNGDLTWELSEEMSTPAELIYVLAAEITPTDQEPQASDKQP